MAFLAPRTRTLAATLLLSAPDQPALRVELIPTGPSDPLLEGLTIGPGQIVLSASAAARLRSRAGGVLNARLSRLQNGTRSSTAFPLTVVAAAPPSAIGRDAAFVPLSLAVQVEDYKDGVADMTATPVSCQEYAGFRLYARRLEDVAALDAALQRDGIEVVSRAGDVAGLLQVDRNLGLLFGLVAGLGGTGFLLSLGAGLWANVARKRVELAHLRFLGLSTAALRGVPVTQAVVLATMGVIAAWAVAEAGALVINRAFAGTLALTRPLCVLSAGLAATTAGVTLSGAVIVALAAGSRVAGVAPWEGISAP